MNDQHGRPDPAAPMVRRGNAFTTAIAWLVILACAGYAFVQTNWPFELVAAPPQAPVATAPEQAADPTAEAAHAPDAAYDNASRIMLAFGDMFFADDAKTREWLLSEAAPLPNAGPSDRLVFVIMAADLVGRERAITALDEIESDDAKNASAETLSPTELELRAALRRLYSSAPNAATRPQSSEADSELLAKGLGWFGRFAPLARGIAGESAERTALLAQAKYAPLIIAGAALWFIFAGSIGVIALLVLLVRAMRGKATPRFVLATGRGGVYAEAFAVFVVVFTAVHLMSDLMPATFESAPAGVVAGLSIAMQIVAFIGSLMWARMRIGDWRLVRQDIGLHVGCGLVRESFAGLLTYCRAVPLLLLGVLMMLALIALRKIVWPDAPMPSHPAQEMLKTADWRAAAQIFVLGVVVAPVIEEVAFRGMLYQHLRTANAKAGAVVSVLVAMLVSSFLFASIHPQSWPAVPALMALAVAFCIGREVRGSLVSSMVAHGVSNLVMLTVGFTLFRG